VDLGSGDSLAGQPWTVVGDVTVASLARLRRHRDPRDHEALQHQVLDRMTAEQTALRIVGSREVERLTALAEAVDGGSPAHSRRVGRAAEAVAARMGLAPHFIDLIREAAPLHDVGKLEISVEILDKPGPLTMRERVAMQRHAAAGEALCRKTEDDPVLRLAAQIARSHHERWDGRGYPDGLAFDRIPLAARIVAVVDVYDALVSERPYKGAWWPEDALAFLAESAGSQFDPDVVAAFVTLAERGELTD